MIKSAFYVLLVVSAIKSVPNSYLGSVVSDLGKWIPFPSISKDEPVEPHKVEDASENNNRVEVETNPDKSIPITNLPDPLSDERIQTSAYDASMRKMKVLMKSIWQGSSQQNRSVGKNSRKKGWLSTLKNLICLCGLLCGGKDEETRAAPTNGIIYQATGHYPYMQSQLQSANDLKSKQYEVDNVAAYAIQGRREYMEDRFVVAKNIRNTGVSLFAVFDGHGGDYASEYVANNLIDSLKDQVHFFKTTMKDVPINELNERVAIYLKQDGGINYEKLLNDEILAVDESLVKSTKKIRNTAGTTALIAVLEKDRLIVANVGDSRGIMCDGEGNAVALSFDHKPDEPSERKRIEEAGGEVTFDREEGVHRIDDLSTSRALGDYPSKVKEKKLVIAKPDIKTFDLSQYKHKPQFLILATDGLWDAFKNEDAVAFVKERELFKEPLSAAKSIVLEAYNKGSQDNITAIVINLSQH